MCSSAGGRGCGKGLVQRGLGGQCAHEEVLRGPRPCHPGRLCRAVCPPWSPLRHPQSLPVRPAAVGALLEAAVGCGAPWGPCPVPTSGVRHWLVLVLGIRKE